MKQGNHTVPGDVPTVTDNVEPSHSRPPEGIVLPKVPPLVYGVAATVLSLSVLLFLIFNSYYNVAH